MNPAAEDSSSSTESIDASLKLSRRLPPGCVVTCGDVAALTLRALDGAVVALAAAAAGAGRVAGAICATTGAVATASASAAARVERRNVELVVARGAEYVICLPGESF